MRMRLPALLALVLALPAAVATAQTTGERWQITLENDEYVWDIQLVKLTGDSLVFRQADTLGSVTLERITELRLINKTAVRLGEGEGGGGTMAALTGANDEIYDFLPLDLPARIRAVQQIFLTHPPAQP